MKAYAKERQTLPDIGIRYGGSLAAAFETAVRNGISITAQLDDGMELDVAIASGAAGKRVVSRYSVDGVEPATEADSMDLAYCPFGGIGNMGIETDFMVS